MNQIELKNVQAHEHLILPLDKVTIIIGDNHTGKTSIIRAIEWCLYRGISTADIWRHNTPFVEVTIEFDDMIITRHVADGEHWCELTIDGKTDRIRSPGPKGPARLDNLVQLKDLNFSRTQSPQFMLQMSPSDRYDMLIEEMGLGELFPMISKLQGQLYKLRSQQTTLSKMVDDFDYGEPIHKLEKGVDLLGKIIAKEDVKSKLERKHSTLLELSQMDAMLKEQLSKIPSEEWLSKVEARCMDRQNKAYELDVLQKNMRTLSGLNKREAEIIEELHSILGHIDVCPVCMHELSEEDRKVMNDAFSA